MVLQIKSLLKKILKAFLKFFDESSGEEDEEGS
jgi:hypothetical protein